MEMKPVVSTSILEMGYDLKTKVMQVLFSSGMSYTYDDVSYEEYVSIFSDKSIGSKLRRVVKDKQYHKLEAAPAGEEAVKFPIVTETMLGNRVAKTFEYSDGDKVTIIPHPAFDEPLKQNNF